MENINPEQDAKSKYLFKSPEAHVRHIAFMADAQYKRSKSDVPFAELRHRRVCFFAYSNIWACFEYGKRIGLTESAVKAARFLQGHELK